MQENQAARDEVATTSGAKRARAALASQVLAAEQQEDAKRQKAADARQLAEQCEREHAEAQQEVRALRARFEAV